MCRACVRLEKKCENCGIIFKFSPSQKRKYCSNACYNENDKRTGVRRETRGWKSKQVSYRTLHSWVEQYKGKPTKCEFCGKDELNRRKIHWANKSKTYQRNLDDFIALCASCHNKYDEKIKNLPSIEHTRDKLGRFTKDYIK